MNNTRINVGLLMASVLFAIGIALLLAFGVFFGFFELITVATIFALLVFIFILYAILKTSIFATSQPLVSKSNNFIHVIRECFSGILTSALITIFGGAGYFLVAGILIAEIVFVFITMLGFIYLALSTYICFKHILLTSE